MDLRELRKVIIYGGTFDPPHTAHIALPVMAMQAAQADAVLYVPAARSPHKTGQDGTPALHRLAMLRLALENVPIARILTVELERAGLVMDGGVIPGTSAKAATRKKSAKQSRPSYTVDTLEWLRAELGPATKIHLLIGSDQLRAFHTWRSPDRVIELGDPLVMIRPPDTRASLQASPPVGFNLATWSKRILDLPPLLVSATDIRKRVAAGQSITGLVPPSVEDYIRRHGLYR